MCRSVLACFCTSLAATAALAGAPAPDPGQVATVEAEVRLARTGDVYLRLDPWRRELAVRSRGVTLTKVSLRGVELLAPRPLFSTSESEPVPLPAVWTVVEGAREVRTLIAPETLRPYDSDENDEASGPSPTPTPAAAPPSVYDATLDNGWVLELADHMPPTSWWQRFLAAARDGFARLGGHVAEPPKTLALIVSTEDAQRLHHLIRNGVQILVVAPPA